jgi:hypothetical protein
VHGVVTPNSKIKEILDSYVIGKPTQEILTEFDISFRSLYRYLKRFQIDKRGWKFYNPRIYDLDDHFFDTIDTEEKSYDLGILLADASIRWHSHEGNIALGLKKEDEEILHKILRSMKSNYPIKYYKSKNGFYRAGFTIYSGHMTRSLIKLGCSPNKTYTIPWPTDGQVPNHLKRHLMRGYTDGDGWLSHHWHFNKFAPQRPEFQYGFAGSHDFCFGAQKWLMEQCGLRATKIAFRNGIWQVAYGGNRQVYRIAKLLYDNCSIFLGRKHENYKFLMECGKKYA